MSDCDSCCRPRVPDPCLPCLGSVTTGSVSIGSDSFPSSYVTLLWFDDQSALIEWNATPSAWEGSVSYGGCTYDLSLTVAGLAVEDIVLEVTDGSATWTFKNYHPIADSLQAINLLYYGRSGTESCSAGDPGSVNPRCVCLIPGFDEVSGCVSSSTLAPVCVDSYAPYRIFRPSTWQITTSGFAGKIRVTEDGAFIPTRWADYYFDNLTSDFNKVWSPLGSTVAVETKCNSAADGYSFCNHQLGLFEQYKQSGYGGTVYSPASWNFRYQWGEGVSGNCWVQAVVTVQIVPQARSSSSWFPDWQFVWVGDVIYITDGISTTQEFELSLLNAFSQSVDSGTLCFSGVNSSWAGREIVDLSEFTMGEVSWEPY